MRIEEKEFIDYIKKHFKYPLTVADVGANIGKYSEYINKNINIKKNFLFEPVQSCYNKIKTNSYYSLYNIGLGNKKEIIEFYEVIGNESHSSLVNREWLFSRPNYNIKKKYIEVDRLDNIIKEKIDILKIDTEGYELKVLEGSEKLLSEKKINFIQFEYGGCFKDNNIKLNDVINFLKKYEYTTFEIKENKWSPISNYEDDYRWVNFFSTHYNIKNIF